MLHLKKYQTEAIENLKQKIKKILKSSKPGLLVFQAPTGSGKTIIMAKTIKELIQSTKKPLSFIWISVRMLHEQSKEKIEKMYQDNNNIKCSYAYELEYNHIQPNEILFINWDSINKKDINVLIRENENNNNLNTIVRNTKTNGHKIILIIDESHHTARSERSRELINIIGPDVVVEVSATPTLSADAIEIERILPDSVKREGMIKNEIVINPNIQNIVIDHETSDEVIMKQALIQREYLRDLYREEGSNVNPLVLIQLPDKRDLIDDKKDYIVQMLKEKFNISQENNKLAIWLSEEKTDNIINITKNNNETEVLIFKQAISLGWDCPRAQILVIFRELHNFVFTIQTIGRIMRMPELRHYRNSELNKGYVFTNLEQIRITEDYIQDYLTIYETKRINEIYVPINLISYKIKRKQLDELFNISFSKFLYEYLVQSNIIQLINTDINHITVPIITNYTIDDLESDVIKSGGLNIGDESVAEINAGPTEVGRYFNALLLDACMICNEFPNMEKIMEGLEMYFREFTNIPHDRIPWVIVEKHNRPIFNKVIIEAIRLYKQKRMQYKMSNSIEEIHTMQWNVPAFDTYSKNYQPMKVKKSIVSPFYISVNKTSNQELCFINLLDNSPNVEWWYKNGENNHKYFAILYQENNCNRLFYVDFIVYFKDGTIGLYDTKSGFTAKDAKAKAEALYHYIQEYKNATGKNMVGGIVTVVGSQFYIHQSDTYEYDKSLSNFVPLVL